METNHQLFKSFNVNKELLQVFYASTFSSHEMCFGVLEWQLSKTGPRQTGERRQKG